MDGRFNTIAGWALGAGIVFLGVNLVVHEFFPGGRPATMGYPINGVEEEGQGGAPAEQPIAFFMQTADAGRGAAAFRKCAGCHTIDQGGGHINGPNLFGTMGNTVAHVAGYAYSNALRNHGGRWDWDTMSRWLASPRDFAAGTRMGFGGLNSPQERADVMLYLNQQGGTLTIPPPPAAAPAEGNAAAGNEAAANSAQGNAAGTANAAAPAANAAAPAGNQAGH